ncbi:M16 family metallopeptidase [Micromonospora sp. DT81.3]|uniref:M16 family metallopeptidase n=1 Tax=Micromonospora sp. DT81.3 TaxID=3416523 RepID=UPI003CED0D17
MPLPSISHLTIDGIPTYVADIRAIYTGTLTFGVGMRDESARTAGTAHLLEHLVMQRVGKVKVAHNATTADETISFYAQGAPHLVADFLSRVATAIATLHQITDADVAEQRRVITAELGEGDEFVGRGPLLNRFGANSLGLLDIGSPAHRSLTREAALAFADSWLHTGNAVLTFTGDVPPGLALHLPAARSLPDRPTPVILPHRRTGWLVDGPMPLAISMLLGPASNAAVGVAGSLLADALHSELRTAQHKIYSVSPFVGAVTANSRFVAYALDPRPEDAVAAGRGAVQVIRTLAEMGPDEAQLLEELDRWSQGDDDPAAQAEVLDAVAVSVVRGRRDPDDLVPIVTEGLTREDIRRVIAAAVPSLFVTFGAGIVSDRDHGVTEALGIPFSEQPEAYTAGLTKTQLVMHLAKPGVALFSPRMFRGMGGWNLAIDHERATLTVPGEPPFEIRFDDVVLAGYSDTDSFWSLVAAGGDGLSLHLDDWRGRAQLHRLLEERLPSEAQFRIAVGEAEVA